MTRLVDAELFKLRTTRTFYGVVIGALALVAIISVAASAASTFDANDVPAESLLGIGGLVQAFGIVLGVLGITTEFRHGTISPTLLVTPQRTRLLVAKLIAHLLAGLLLGLLAFALCAAIVLGILTVRDIESGLPAGDVARIVAGGTAATALYAVLGLGLGALVRNQVGALVAILAYLFVIEPLLTIVPAIADEVTRYGLGGVGSGLTGTSGDTSQEILDQLPAGLLLLAYTAVFVAAGRAMLRRRDVTA